MNHYTLRDKMIIRHAVTDTINAVRVYMLCLKQDKPCKESKEKFESRLNQLLSLLKNNPNPIIDSVFFGTNLKRLKYTGDGSKKQPFRIEWNEDIFKD